MKLKVVMAISLLAPFILFGQVGVSDSANGPQTTLRRFVEMSNKQSLLSPEARQLLMGEAERWDMPSFGKLADGPDKVNMLDQDRAVGRIQGFGPDDNVIDLYFYLRRDTGSWKIEAMRRLAMTGLLESLYSTLKAKKSLTQEEEETFANISLTLASDSALRDWFRQNRDEIGRLTELARNAADGKWLNINDRDEKFPDVAQRLKRLQVSLVTVQAEGNVEIVIGGLLDNSVGFLQSPKGTPPAISASNHIWVEEVADQWYLFRTT